MKTILAASLLLLLCLQGVSPLPLSTPEEALPSAVEDKLSLFPRAAGDLIYKVCSRDSIFTVSDVQITQNGQQLSATATIYASERVTGGKVVVEGYNKGLPFLKKSMTLDLCMQVQCPIEKGERQISVSETFPISLPSGTYVISLKAWDDHNRELLCINGQVKL